MHQISRKKLEQNYFINSKEIFRPYKYNSYYIYMYIIFSNHIEKQKLKIQGLISEHQLITCIHLIKGLQFYSDRLVKHLEACFGQAN